MATLCAVLLTGCSGSDPSDSVMELVKNGDIEQAQQIYAEKISGKEEYESSFAEKFIPYLENLIESYNNGELSEEKINDDFETYKEMLGENVTFKDVESQLSALEISKHCFETAEKLRLEGELTQAYRMYARVIKKDRCYETAQQYITQIPADYLLESEDLFEGGQYQEAVRQSILGYALLDDKSGFDEIAIKVTKRLAEDYGFDNAAVLVEADSFYNTYYDVSVKCDSYKGKSLESMSRNDIVKLYKGFHDIFFNAVTNAWKGTGGSCLFLLEDIYSDGKWYNVNINNDEVEIRSESERSNYRQEMKEWSDTTLLCLTFYEPPFLPHGIFLAFKYFTILFLLVKYGMEINNIWNVILPAMLYSLATLSSTMINKMAMNTVVASFMYGSQIVTVFLVTYKMIKRNGVYVFVDWLAHIFGCLAILSDLLMLFIHYDFSNPNEEYVNHGI